MNNQEQSSFTFEVVGKITGLKEIKYQKDGVDKEGTSFILVTPDGGKHEFRVFGYASKDARELGELASVAISGDIIPKWNKITTGKYEGREFYKPAFWNVKIQKMDGTVAETTTAADPTNPTDNPF